LRTLRLILVLIGCLHLCGGHYGVIQMFAWGKMIVAYSAEKGLTKGVKATFDGDHPCEICSSIAKAKKDESKSPELPWKAELKKLELKNLFPVEYLAAKKPRSGDFTPPDHLEPDAGLPLFRKSPDTPPPRLG
jgi:hypothetical protein